MIGGKPLPKNSAPRLNLDKHGLPKDYATYVWLLYKKIVQDESPERILFLYGPKKYEGYFGFGLQYDYR